MTSFETNNKYDIKNNLDQMIYTVTEDTDDFTRNAYRTLRPFVLRVTDYMGREIMTMQRPFRCTCCCFCCPSTRQEVRGWKFPLFLPDPGLLSIVVLLRKLYRRVFSLALQIERREEARLSHLRKIRKGFFLVGSGSSVLIGGSSTNYWFSDHSSISCVLN